MIRPLVAKEARDQRPFLGLALLLLLLNVLSALWEPLGFSPYAVSLPERFDPDDDLSVLTFLLAFALGSGLLVREQDDRTLEFLDALPTSRWTIFWVKVLVALATVLVYPLGMTAWTLVEQVLSRTSLEPGLHLDVIGVASVLRVVQALFVLALGLALAPLRRLCWTLLAVLMLAQGLLEDRAPGWSALNPFRLTAPAFEGNHWRWPVEALRLQLSVTAALLALALVQFLGWGERLLAAAQQRLQGSWLGVLASAATVGLFLAVFMRWGGVDDEAATSGEEIRVEFPTSASAQADTRHYHFTYPASLRQRTEPLLRGADAAFEKARAFLGVEAGEPIRVDLGGSMRHTAGTAYWNTLRMGLENLSGDEEALAVLGHETTHVLSQRIVGPQSAPRLADMHLFAEGLATYVEYRFFHPPDALEEYHWIAAAARARREVKTEELLAPDKLAAERDANWVYPLGRAFVEALVRRHGEGAPARVLAALGRKEAPEGLQDALLWQDAFQTAGIDLSQVFDDFFAGLDEQVARHQQLIASLPRPRAAVEPSEHEVLLRPVLDTPPPEGWRVVCRFRARETSRVQTFDGPFDCGESLRRDRARLSRDVLWYQMGLRGPKGLVLYEPWTSVRVE
ncbi:ABC transporter permease [Cystobacter fuscus]|uniref:ABC transporter permease n=1 Tax=Cystobacter fuscus TaxID=43 RepID=UPI002B2B0D9C|nr:ABC transporter permease [Cystobacter fuscus]